jgi:methionyl-tRNA formyltransferase
LGRWLDGYGNALGGPLTPEGSAFDLPWIWLENQDLAEVAALEAVQPDLLLVGNFGVILRRPILAVPRIGTINLHWSLLPRHRGPQPATSVLLSGDAETGLTFHVVDERIDTGPILEQVRFDVRAADTASTLYHRSVEAGVARVVPLLDRIEREGLVGEPQNPKLGFYRKKITVPQSYLDFRRPAVDLERQVRALVSPLARFGWRGRPVVVTVARVLASVPVEPGTLVQTRGRLVVACGEGSLALDACWQQWPPGPWPLPWQRVLAGERLVGADGGDLG